jgi:2-keto-4-pentenoate hydratase
MKQANPNQASPDTVNCAKAFVEARQTGCGLTAYPGKMPASLDEAYAIQDEAIKFWDDEITGWKVGRITGAYEAELGTDRLAGPVFSKVCFSNVGAGIVLPVFAEGFAAIVGEITAVIG